MSNTQAAAKNECAVCGQHTTSKCGRCRLVYYCGAEHQMERWKAHKAACKEKQTKTPPAPNPTQNTNTSRPFVRIPTQNTNTSAPSAPNSTQNTNTSAGNVTMNDFAADPSSRAQAYPGEKGYEWLVDCYRMRLDDEYAFRGDVQGYYDPGATRLDVLADFLKFCKCAVGNGVIPENGWVWRDFLAKAGGMMGYAFERDDAKEKYNGENMFSFWQGKPSLTAVGKVIYQRSFDGMMERFQSPALALVERIEDEVNAWVEENEEAEKDRSPDFNVPALFGDVGGSEIWGEFFVKLADMPPIYVD